MGTIRNYGNDEDSTISAEQEDHHNIPLPNVKGAILARVLEYCKFHVDARRINGVSYSCDCWDASFVSRMDRPTLFETILAANYLNVDGLLDLTCAAAAETIREKTSDQVRSEYMRLTPAEQERNRRGMGWASN